MEVKQEPGVITICQSTYTSKIVEQCGMKGCNPVDTPMEQRVKLVEGDKETAGCYKVQKCDWKLEVSSAYQT